MIGNIDFEIYNKRGIKYKFSLMRNISIILGDSGTGKTTLINMIQNYESDKENSGITLICKYECKVLNNTNWKDYLKLNNCIFFIDESNDFIYKKDEKGKYIFLEQIQKKDNFYVFITRESLSVLPYSVDCIYEIKGNKTHEIKQVYKYIIDNENWYERNNKIINKVVTEDNNSGKEYFDNIKNKLNANECVSAEGKANLYKFLNIKENNLLIADRAAFGADIKKVVGIIQHNKKGNIYLPESFEWLLLMLNVTNDKEIKKILKEPIKYVDSKNDFSWERYFYKLIIEKYKGTKYEYSKKKLNKKYLSKNLILKMMKIMKKNQK